MPKQITITSNQIYVLIALIFTTLLANLGAWAYKDNDELLIEALTAQKALLKTKVDALSHEKETQDLIANQAIQQLAYKTEENKRLKEQLRKLGAPMPWKPKPTLALWQEKKCMAILLFGEDRASEEEGLVKIANVVDNRVKHEKYQSNACKVAAEGFGVQFSSMKPYLGRIKSIVWGGSQDYVPTVAKNNKLEMQAWNRIVKLVDEIYAGEHYLLTNATHFLAPTGINKMPSWAKAFRPVDVSTGHVFFIDHEFRDGKIHYYTKQNPFNQAEFNGVKK